MWKTDIRAPLKSYQREYNNYIYIYIYIYIYDIHIIHIVGKPEQYDLLPMGLFLKK